MGEAGIPGGKVPGIMIWYGVLLIYRLIIEDFKPKVPGLDKVMGSAGLEQNKDSVDRVKVQPEPGIVVKTFQQHNAHDDEGELIGEKIKVT